MNLAKLSLAAIFCLSTFTARPQTQEAPKPVHPEKWSNIENYIRDNWNDFVDTMPSLPKPYCYALNPGTLYYWDLYFINEGLMRQGFSNRPATMSTTSSTRWRNSVSFPTRTGGAKTVA